ncbi:unnamed protein product [Amoebophrya sp. A25]|nr:unnamed protein product [Amoebophrya sp. A25]|eukprot:GSA25T00025226001.1
MSSSNNRINDQTLASPAVPASPSAVGRQGEACGVAPDEKAQGGEDDSSYALLCKLKAKQSLANDLRVDRVEFLASNFRAKLSTKIREATTSNRNHTSSSSSASTTSCIFPTNLSALGQVQQGTRASGGSVSTTSAASTSSSTALHQGASLSSPASTGGNKNHQILIDRDHNQSGAAKNLLLPAYDIQRQNVNHIKLPSLDFRDVSSLDFKDGDALLLSAARATLARVGKERGKDEERRKDEEQGFSSSSNLLREKKSKKKRTRGTRSESDTSVTVVSSSAKASSSGSSAFGAVTKSAEDLHPDPPKIETASSTRASSSTASTIADAACDPIIGNKSGPPGHGGGPMFTTTSSLSSRIFTSTATSSTTTSTVLANPDGMTSEQVPSFGRQSSFPRPALTEEEQRAALHKRELAKKRMESHQKRIEGLRSRVSSLAAEAEVKKSCASQHHPTTALLGSSMLVPWESEIRRELEAVKSASKDVRQTFFRKMMLKYHPDKQQQQEDDARGLGGRDSKKMFQYLMEQQKWFLG